MEEIKLHATMATYTDDHGNKLHVTNQTKDGFTIFTNGTVTVSPEKMYEILEKLSEQMGAKQK